MTAHEDRLGQIIKLLSTFFAGIPTTAWLSMVLAAFINLIGCAMWTMDTVRPTYLPNDLITFAFVYKIVDAKHGSKMQILPHPQNPI
jgi:hypothetical protein